MAPLLRLAFEHSSDLLVLMRVERDGRIFAEQMNASAGRFFAQVMPEWFPDAWRADDMATLYRERGGFDAARIDAMLAPHRKAIRTRKPVSAASELATHTGKRLSRRFTITPLLTRGGRVSHLFYHGVDLTRMREAEERFEGLFNVSPVPIVVGRLSDGGYLAANPAWLKLHGYRREELDGQSSLTLGVWGPEARERAVAMLRRDGEIRALPTQFRTKDGSTINTLYYATLVEWLGEAAIIAAPQDVTELERLRQEAELQREHFESLFRLSPNPSSVTTLADGRYLALNEAWAKAMGFAPHEMLGQLSLELGIWPDAAERERFVGALKEGGALRQLPVRFRTRTGEIRQMRISSELIQWAGATAILSSMHDVSDLERARNEALASSERFLQLFESNPVPITIARIPDGTLLEVNRAWLEFKGMTRAQAIGQTRDTIGSWVSRELRDRIVAEVTAGNPVRNVPARLRGRGEDVRDILYSGFRVEWMGEPAIVAFLVEVTEIQRASDEIRRLNESLEQSVRERTAELEQANRDLESFSYTVSHDLRSPLGAINGFAHLLRTREGGRLSEDGDKLLALLEKDAERMALLVDGLLEFSRLGRKPVTRHAVAMAALAAEVVEAVRVKHDAQRAEFRIAPLPPCQGDAILLRQVWWNLVDNAVKYSRERERALVEIGYEAPQAAYFVRDNGAGFDMQHAAKLFGMFERVHTDAEFEGTGIGLAHAARIVERHGGRIWCQAAPGSGATFYFTLGGSEAPLLA